MRVFVTGGTGDLGGRLVPRLEKAGHEVAIGTRHPASDNHLRYDLADDPPPLDGFDVVVHLATTTLKPDVDLAGATRLWEAARAAGVGHVIYMSIVGVDDHAYPYYRAKAEAERQLADSGVPFTILRATQFHGLIPRFVDEIAGRSLFVPVPAGIRVQPIDADVVAERLAELVDEGPSQRVPDLAGGQALSLDEMVKAYLEARGGGAWKVRTPAWGRVVADFRAGKHLAPGVDSGGETYAEYLTTVTPRRPDPVGVSLRVLSITFFGIMAWMLAAPSSFFSTVAGFGDFNSHFVRDTGAFVLPLAAVLWLAASRPSWRVPVLVTALLHNALHIVNHLIDVGNADPAWHGPATLIVLVVLQLAMWKTLSFQRTAAA